MLSSAASAYMHDLAQIQHCETTPLMVMFAGYAVGKSAVPRSDQPYDLCRVRSTTRIASHA